MDNDKLKEECGVFGVFGHPDAAALTALGFSPWVISEISCTLLLELFIALISCK